MVDQEVLHVKTWHWNGRAGVSHDNEFKSWLTLYGYRLKNTANQLKMQR